MYEMKHPLIVVFVKVDREFIAPISKFAKINTG